MTVYTLFFICYIEGVKNNKLTISKDKLSEIKKASTDALSIEQGTRQTVPSQSVEAFSVAVVSPFESEEESRLKINNFIGEYFNIRKKYPDFSLLQDYNSKLPFSFTDKELKDIYVKVLESLQQVPSQTISFQDLMQQEFPKARYSIEPFFEQGTVNMVSAPPNSWKSWLLFLFAIHIGQGTDVFEKFPSEQAKVMIVNEEDSFRAIQDRFRILQVKDNNISLFFRVANGSKLESKFITSLIDELKEKQIGVVMFDSLRSMHEADENDSTTMQIILDQLKRIAREGITVIFTHHHRKKGMFEKGSSAESSRGSSAINAAISGHISLDEEERELGLFLVVRHLKSKAGEKLQPFDLKIIKEEGSVRFQYDGEFKQAEKKIKQTKDQIMELLQDGKWKSTRDFEEVIEVGKTTMKQALTSLKNDGVIISIGRLEAIKKSIPVREKGNARELYYSLNTDSAEMITREDEEATQEAFDNYND